ILEDIDAATSPEESIVLTTKLGIVAGMSIFASSQLLGLVLGIFRSFAWVMSGPAIVATAVLGIAYFLISMAANRYKREDLRLWLYRCNWGRGAVPKWTDSHGHADQMQSLLNILMRPSVLGRASTYGGERMPKKWLGHWVQIQFPATQEGQIALLQPTLSRKASMVNEENLHALTSKFYDNYLNGNWVDPKLLGRFPDSHNKNYNEADYACSKKDQHRLWQVWVETPLENPILEINISYAHALSSKNTGHIYAFRLALDEFSGEADRQGKPLDRNLPGEFRIELNSARTIAIAIPQVK
ncbi:hypothetical protein SJI00_22235, partial [Pseudomonas sp. RP23018S]|nr:hypothetical protein [Pseudomonas sp. RP23018S]